MIYALVVLGAIVWIAWLTWSLDRLIRSRVQEGIEAFRKEKGL